MLNPSFSKELEEKFGSNYYLPEELTVIVTKQNKSFSTGPEKRLQEVFTYEIWEKLYSLGFKEEDFQNKEILDVCAGTGFLSFHLLKRINPKKILLLDISKNEIREAKKLINKNYGLKKVEYLVADILKSQIPNNSFDFIVGNSFLHHFYNVPQAIREFFRILKPGGIFISLHEPTPRAIAYEWGNILLLFKSLLVGDNYFGSIRYKDNNAVQPNNGADVWLFKSHEIKKIFEDISFNKITVDNWNIARPLTFRFFNLHLNDDKNKLNNKEKKLFLNSITIDKALKKILPKKLFGSVAISAQKPKLNYNL